MSHPLETKTKASGARVVVTETTESRQDRFTATGRTIPAHAHSSVWERSCPWGLQAPFLPPFRFSDESIIPVIVRIQEFDSDEKGHSQGPRSNMFKRLKSQVKRTANRSSRPPFVCVFMPRREYLKHFAYDGQGTYVGTEAQRSWSKEELDEKFGGYQNSQPKRWVTCKQDGRVFMTEDVPPKGT